MQNLCLFPEMQMDDALRGGGQSTTFADNMRLPVHRWFRFSAGFSAEWVREVITQRKLPRSATVLDPFAGSGTTLLACQNCGVNSVGLEAHPFLVRIAAAKLKCTASTDSFRDHARRILRQAEGYDRHLQHEYGKLIHACFPEPILADLDAVRTAWERLADDSSATYLSWLALTAALRISSPVGTAQMELIQPKKRKTSNLPPFVAFWMQVENMCDDMRAFQRADLGEAVLYRDDARVCASVPDESIELVITSPPYANNYDYADATRLEMSFWGEVNGWADLQSTIRKYLIRSCSQHASAERLDLGVLLADPDLSCIRTGLAPVCRDLDRERLSHGGNKKYHLMVAAYFADMAKVWHALRRVCRAGVSACFVVGDSAPYGVYVPVHEWLGELALSAGFSRYTFERTRDRNTKWKNRKHRVPLCEGRLWVQG